MAIQSCALAGKVHGQSILAGYYLWGSERVGCDLATGQQQQRPSQLTYVKRNRCVVAWGAWHELQRDMREHDGAME